MFAPLKSIRSEMLVLAQENIDTDQIIPARFLTTTSREGLGKAAFYDWRYDDHGQPLADSPLRAEKADGRAILVAGANFGCGSSREHAPWALYDFGIRVVISSEIADIFSSNALKNGLLPLCVDEEAHRYLLANPGLQVQVDLETLTLTAGNHTLTFDVEPFARQCLLQGRDSLGVLLTHTDDITAYEAAQK
ncbi:MAG: 3-isopropylmalate dehydratase small subunit [Pseudomonadota bacterium]